MSTPKSADSIKYLNTFKVDVFELRQFLADLSKDYEEIGAGDLICAIKALSKKPPTISPLRNSTDNDKNER